jgi:hypothetical protein
LDATERMTLFRNFQYLAVKTTQLGLFSHKGFISVGFLAAQSVVHMKNPKLDLRSLHPKREEIKEQHRIETARAGDKVLPAISLEIFAASKMK